MDESCTHCGKMTISELRSRFQLLQRGGVPVPLPRSNSPQRVAASGDTGDLRITVSAFPSGNQPPRNPHSSCTPQPAELPEERGGPSQRCAPSVSSLATRSRTSPSSSRLYRSSLRRLATSCPGGPLLHPLCRRQHLSLLVAEGDPLRLPPVPRHSNSLHPSGAVEPVVSGVPSPSRPAPRGAAKPRARGPRTGDPEMIGTALQEMVTAPFLPPEEGRVVNPLFFPSVPPFCSHIFNKRAVSVISRSEEGSKSSGRSKTSPLSSTSSVASGQQRAVRDGHPSLSCTPCPTVEPGKCCTAHSDPAKGRLPKRAPRAASLRSTSLPHCGYASGPLGPTCAVSASLVSAPQSVSLAHSDHQAMNI